MDQVHVLYTSSLIPPSETNDQVNLIWKKVAGLFAPLISELIFLLLENSNNFDQNNFD